jgi:hypothetical protein
MIPALSREVKDVALALCDGLSGALSEKVKACILEGRWDDLIKIEVDPRNYSHPESYFSDVACTSFLRKYEPLPTTVDRKKVAVDGFFEAEMCCYRTNQRLQPFLGNTYGVEDEAMMEFILLTRKEVVDLIGTRPPSSPAGIHNHVPWMRSPFEVSAFMEGGMGGRFGPGSTYGDRGVFTTIPDKMSSSPTITRGAWSFLVPWSGTLWAKAVASRGESIEFVRGNRFTTVTKDCTKHRGICIGPSINLFFQLAYGEAMKGRLESKGLNLLTAPDLHRLVACEASITGKRATIDLSQASDNQAYNLVKLVLPPQWFEPLNDLREPTTEIEVDGIMKTIVLEKFSAMGNGYTFELETVIFMAICNAVYRLHGHKPLPSKNVFVFGDDIIVNTELAADVIAALRFFGFKPNEKKTFLAGPFRESCGGDYFEGVDVRPYFLKELPSEPQQFIAMANGLRRMVRENHFAGVRGRGIHRAWFRALDALPSDIKRCRGPESLGDLVIHDETEFWQTRTRSSIRYLRVYRPATFKQVNWDHFDSEVLLAGACYGVPSNVPLGKPWGGGFIIPRDGVTGYKQGWVRYS